LSTCKNARHCEVHCKAFLHRYWQGRVPQTRLYSQRWW